MPLVSFPAAPSTPRTRETAWSATVFHQPATVQTAVGQVDLGDGGNMNQGHCRSCHSPEGSLRNLDSAHRQAATLYHAQAARLADVSPSAACLRCHDQGSQSSWMQAVADEALVFNPHASHPYGVPYRPRATRGNWQLARVVDHRIPLFEGKVECQSCHLLTSGTENLLIPFPSRTELCLGCHQETAPPTDSPEAYLATMVKD